MSRYVEDYEQIQSFRGALATFLEETRDTWGSLRSQLTELEAEGWQGPDASEFREIFDELDGNLSGTFQAIDERHIALLDSVLSLIESRGR